MIFKTLILNIFVVFFVETKIPKQSKYYLNFDQKIVLKTHFTDEKFTIDMSYANDTVNILGHALTNDVKQCATTIESFAPHCIKTVQNNWPKADQKYQRIPQFYFDEIDKKNISYYFDFGTGSPLFEGFKCCIIYDILDCIHAEYKSRCLVEYKTSVIFAPIDEVIHLFAMQIQDKCDGYHIENGLYDTINQSGERYHLKKKKDNKNCKKQFLKNSDKFIPRTNIYLISITILILIRL